MPNRAPGDVVRPGVTEPSGLADEAECPSDHFDLKPNEACTWCKGVV